jgi:hypothetical protein
MLAADGSSTCFADATGGASFEAPESLEARMLDASVLEATVRDLLVVVKRVTAAFRVSPPSESARAELARARYLLETLGVELAAPPAEESARIADDGTWFETAAGRVDVARRGAIRRILAALAAKRTATPGEAFDVDELFAIGWPGEKIPYESQVRRVYTAIWTLRTLGLDGILITRDEGYLLDPKQPVALAA